MTIGALATNVLLYASLFSMLKAEAARQNISEVALFGFLVFRTVEWATLAHVLTRLALALGRRHDLPAGFSYLRPGFKPFRTVLLGIATGVAASALGYALVRLWVTAGIFERPIWVEMAEAGATWRNAVWGGVRNLFSEEVVTRLGVQTLLLYHLRRFRWAPWVAIVLSSLFFEVWHSGGTDFFLINFAASLLFAWSFARFGYEVAAIAHCVTDWLAIGLPLFFLTRAGA